MKFYMLALFILVSLIATVFAGEISISVAAGELDRRETIVSFPWPQASDGAWRLRDEGGATTPLQLDSAKTARFILKELKAEQTKNFVLEKDTEVRQGGVLAVRKGSQVEVTVGGKKVLCYQAEKSALPEGVLPIFERGGYIHPVLTPSGKTISDDFPADHRHHHGIWMPWTKTEFEGRKPDFWNMGGKSGLVEFSAKQELPLASGPVFASIKTWHRFQDTSATPAKTALNETWDVIVYNVGMGDKKYFAVDFMSVQECASDSPLKLPKYHYGGLGFRGHKQWLGENDKCLFLTSEGKTRANGNETRGRWCHVGGLIDGEISGMAFLDHPENFRAPQPMRLNPKEPFFCYAPSQLGDWEISPGKPCVSRYRFIISDGGPDKVELERQWNDYATPPVVTVK